MRSSSFLANSITKSSDVPNTREIYHSMSHLRAHSVRLGKPLGLNLVYGFGLGRLFHRPTASSPATWDNLDDTGFYILCSATDKSIWAAFDFTPITETGERRTVQPEYGDQYGRLPNDRSNSAIGVQKLFGREWTAKIPPTLDGAILSGVIWVVIHPSRQKLLQSQLWFHSWWRLSQVVVRGFRFKFQ